MIWLVMPAHQHYLNITRNLESSSYGRQVKEAESNDRKV